MAVVFFFVFVAMCCTQQCPIYPVLRCLWLCVPVSGIGWLLQLMLYSWTHTHIRARFSTWTRSLGSPQPVRPDALHLQPPTWPHLIPFILPPNPCIVSHLDRSHCHFLATHRWLRDCASRCIVGNHFDQARGHSQGQYISSSACIRSYQGRAQELTPKE